VNLQEASDKMTEVIALKIPDTIDSILFESLIKHVDPEKANRIRRFVREEDRLRGLFGDLLIRSILMNKTGLKNKEISFRHNEYGKPILGVRDDVHFNLSHSGIWVVAALDSRPVGVDVEQIAPIDLSISRNFFSEDEHHDLMSRYDRLSYFFTLWTLKESYIKNLGKGLSHPLNAFSIKFITQDKIALMVEGQSLEDVSFAQYNLHSDYKMALCAAHDNLPKKVTMHSAEQLVRNFLDY
jgi:4'-phosphopantetheinyl transferase